MRSRQLLLLGILRAILVILVAGPIIAHLAGLLLIRALLLICVDDDPIVGPADGSLAPTQGRAISRKLQVDHEQVQTSALCE